MAVSSLTRMTVPLASDQSASNQGLLMPKLGYRFRVIFENFGVSTPRTELTKQVIDFKRPNVTFTEIPIELYNSTLYLAGKYKWTTTTCNVRDDASGHVSRLVGEQLQKQMDFFEMASAAAGIDYKFTTTYQVLDGGNGAATPVVLEQWELYGCYLEGADYGTTSYSDNKAMQIAMTIRYDNANQVSPGNLGVGSTVAQALNRTIEAAGGAVTG